MKILPIQIQIQKELFQCASSWTVEHCFHPCQAGAIRQQIQERVQRVHTYTETDALQAILTGPGRVNDQHNIT